MTTRKVYIVTQGVYSNYHIERVFSSEELARDYVEKMNDTREAREWDSDKYRYEEYIIDQELPMPPNKFFFHVTLLMSTGDVKTIYKTQSYGNVGGTFNKAMQEFNIDVIAEDEQGAAKIANEQRAIVLSTLQCSYEK